MLGARTKQVFAYGRRGHRIVNVSDDTDRRKLKEADHIDTRRENAVPESPLVSSKSLKASVVQKSSQRAGAGKKSPKVVKVGAAAPSKSRRHILGSLAPNAPASPAVAPPLKAKRRQTAAKPSALAPSSPIVNLDIVVLDGQGRRVSQERRISRSDVTANILAAPALEPKAPARARGAKRAEPIVLSSDYEEEAPAARPKRNTRARKAAPIIISDDESSGAGSDYAPPSAASPDADSSLEISTPIPKARRGPARSRVNVILSPPPSPSPSPPSSPLATPPVHVEAFPLQEKRKADPPPILPASIARTYTLPSQPVQPPRPQQLAPFASVSQIDEAGPSRSKPRCLTPIRARPRRALFPAPPSPPSPTTPTDLDVTFDFAQLSLSPNALAEVRQLDEAAPLQPAHIRPLLEECAQTVPHEFSAFIEMFPFDPIVQDTSGGRAGPPRFLKIGEASFSEVFGIGGVVLKIIPLRDEERMGALGSEAVDGPAPSDAKDVLKEMIVTRAMGATCPGFVELLRTYVVRGKYPSLLLDLWDEYDERKGSEGVRPDTFSVSQLYAIIVLPNGGPDLEAYTFSTPTKTGWRQACSVFWQVARTLADAEELVSFEHRDLHWGQILVKNVPAKGTAAAGRRKTRAAMDDAAHGVLVTIIDLGLARMDAHDADGHRVHWTPFDEETFEGEGDYQFDVYRMMRTHNGDAWEDYRPLTNVMWLHYLAGKLLKSKRLRVPAAARKSTAAAPAMAAAAAAFSERDCYECLKEVEALLAQCLAPQAPRKGRRKTQAPGKVGKATGPQSAGELVALAVERAWVS
ncbi:Serine/threonine-protein kinase haspin -like protein [Trametes pubescens]|uniref:non-specific serine/threonine protein kinase n=1 Tax=Trametes pubescens TaxID=154538 RepID=A0A1M2VCL8_TRAPU|nr:Serine/threonine-protein kinase haspin -like protein [Trametes pubescens]